MMTKAEKREARKFVHLALHEIENYKANIEAMLPNEMFKKFEKCFNIKAAYKVVGIGMNEKIR